MMNKSIYPCLWFDGQALAAANFYCGVFEDAEIISENELVVMFRLRDEQYMALNGGPMFKFNEAVSFVVNCADQKEIDYFWDQLTANGGEESMCGWLKDKYGLSWQIIPANLSELISGEHAESKMQALLKMQKINIQALKDAG